jgi:hypothetical protein
MGRLAQLTDINETHTIEARWENTCIKNIIMKTSEEVIGKQKRPKRNPWFHTVRKQDETRQD